MFPIVAMRPSAPPAVFITGGIGAGLAGGGEYIGQRQDLHLKPEWARQDQSHKKSR